MTHEKKPEQKISRKIIPQRKIFPSAPLIFAFNKLRVYYISRSYSIVSEPNPKITTKCVETSECLDGKLSVPKRRKGKIIFLHFPGKENSKFLFQNQLLGKEENSMNPT